MIDKMYLVTHLLQSVIDVLVVRSIDIYSMYVTHISMAFLTEETCQPLLIQGEI